jgi:uncharacterized protein
MTEPDYEAAIHYALGRLHDELAPALTYHNEWHTRDDVLPAVQRLARAYRLKPRQKQLLAVAAAFHDIGFVQQVDDHEQIGAQIAAALLPRFGFGPEDIACITSLILATRVTAQPQNLLQGILRDADLDVLGRDDFLARGHALWVETAALRSATPWANWLHEHRAFLRRHRYFTAAARSLRDEGKRQNMVLLEELLRQIAMPASENLEEL